MRKTTCVISPVRVLKVSSRVYWSSRAARRSRRGWNRPMVRAIVACTMTATGAWSRKRWRISSIKASLPPWGSDRNRNNSKGLDSIREHLERGRLSAPGVETACDRHLTDPKSQAPNGATVHSQGLSAPGGETACDRHLTIPSPRPRTGPRSIARGFQPLEAKRLAIDISQSQVPGPERGHGNLNLAHQSHMYRSSNARLCFRRNVRYSS